ncbi:Fe-S cluster assembly protein SufD [Gemmobacter tilapiae]|uniref:Fe-S cluster assembly protein SufD n=1 Tax=Neogemmobacter tilapiae TaxID=875041 RepID=A0A918WFF7_9RHOB|nr:Fe-S cluster assembly protein SufD [Gemmobacter tilapiae]
MGALVEAKQAALAALLAGLGDMPAFAGAARAAALARVQGQGLPVKRDEYWRYSDPSRLTTPQAKAGVAVEDAGFEGIDALRIVFVDGVFDAGASDDLGSAGVEITLLSKAGGDHWAGADFGVLEAEGQVPVARPLAGLNTAFAAEGVLIRATGAASRPVALVHRQTRADSDVMLHHVIRVEEGASLTLLESGTGGARFNHVAEVLVGEGAAFHHIRVQGRDEARAALTHLFARVGAEGLFKSFTLTMNGSLTRNEAILTLAGDDGVAHVAGAAIGDGAFHHDDTVFVTHQALRCESRQVYKKVLKGGAVGVFQGKILVKQGAQKTDGYQISQSLLLDDDSQFLAKPELEIYADDVKCSHGSTSGAIDETALFYLQSRGVPEPVARHLLILAFLADAMAEIEDEAIAEHLGSLLRRWQGMAED